MAQLKYVEKRYSDILVLEQDITRDHEAKKQYIENVMRKKFEIKRILDGLK